jgi:hypothetical protein
LRVGAIAELLRYDEELRKLGEDPTGSLAFPEGVEGDEGFRNRRVGRRRNVSNERAQKRIDAPAAAALTRFPKWSATHGPLATSPNRP